MIARKNSTCPITGGKIIAGVTNIERIDGVWQIHEPIAGRSVREKWKDRTGRKAPPATPAVTPGRSVSPPVRTHKGKPDPIEMDGAGNYRFLIFNKDNPVGSPLGYAAAAAAWSVIWKTVHGSERRLDPFDFIFAEAGTEWAMDNFTLKVNWTHDLAVDPVAEWEAYEATFG